jgi:hypothetical protein
MRTYEKLKPHPLAEALPDMSVDEYAELVEDISENGLRDRIIIFEGKK